MATPVVGQASHVLPQASVQALQALQKQARLLSKQFLHDSAVAVSGSALSMTHAFGDVSCLHVGYYLEA